MFSEDDTNFSHYQFTALGDSVCKTFKVPLTDNMYVMGRKSTCDIHLDDNGISREHAKLYINGKRAQILDNNSANGISVNEQIVTNSYIYPGDLLEIGNNIFMLIFD